MQILSIGEYVNQYYGSDRGAKAQFARDSNVLPQQITKWQASNVKVCIDSESKSTYLFSEKRDVEFIVKAFNDFDMNSSHRYPLYFRQGKCALPRSAFITLDIRTGAVNANYAECINSGVPSDVFNNLILRFGCDELVTKTQINDFINENLPKFQRLLSIFKVGVKNGNTKGLFINGYENSEEILDLQHFVECNLVSSENLDYVVTDLSEVSIYSYFVDGCMRRSTVEDWKKGIKSWMNEYTLVGFDNEEDVKNQLIDEFISMMEDEDSLPKKEVISLLELANEQDADLDEVQDHINILICNQ